MFDASGNHSGGFVRADKERKRKRWGFPIKPLVIKNLGAMVVQGTLFHWGFVSTGTIGRGHRGKQNGKKRKIQQSVLDDLSTNLSSQIKC